MREGENRPSEIEIQKSKIEMMEPPKIEGGEFKQINKEGGVFEQNMTDMDGRIIYRRESSDKSDWQTFKKYDEHGRIESERTQNATQGKEADATRKFLYKKNSTSEEDYEGFDYEGFIGTINRGPDKGHQYKETPVDIIIREDGQAKHIIKTEILEQGENGSGKKSAKGDIFIKTIYFNDSGKWQGEKVLHPDGTTTEQKPDTVEKIPDW
ncbi:hypothetical protein KKF61_03645 [Patescibacteria group bacterium]|nr:hypothetical protein [Patescibacteria group bacterium]MBU0964468.1 hypothetical protein [Patescibacteria group bacterium]